MTYVLLATDADWIRDEVQAAISSPTMSIGVISNGKDLISAVKERTPDLVITDLQVGNMGGMAITMTLRLEESGGRLPRIPVLVLLDRRADLHLARRSAADGWLIKPLDPTRIHAAVAAIRAGGTWFEGIESPSDSAALESDVPAEATAG